MVQLSHLYTWLLEKIVTLTRWTFVGKVMSLPFNTLFQFSSVAQSCPTLRPHESQHARPSLSITNSWSSLRLASIESVITSSHLILGRPLLLLPPIPPSIRVFSNESTLRTRWPKYWSFSFSITPSKEIPGLISFRMDCLGCHYFPSKEQASLNFMAAVTVHSDFWSPRK